MTKFWQDWPHVLRGAILGTLIMVLIIILRSVLTEMASSTLLSFTSGAPTLNKIAIFFGGPNTWGWSVLRQEGLDILLYGFLPGAALGASYDFIRRIIRNKKKQ